MPMPPLGGQHPLARLVTIVVSIVQNCHIFNQRSSRKRWGRVIVLWSGCVGWGYCSCGCAGWKYGGLIVRVRCFGCCALWGKQTAWDVCGSTGKGKGMCEMERAGRVRSVEVRVMNSVRMGWWGACTIHKIATFALRDLQAKTIQIILREKSTCRLCHLSFYDFLKIFLLESLISF
jgi:hypothetical protein